MQTLAQALYETSPFAAVMGQNELPRMAQNVNDFSTSSLFVKGLAKGVSERQLFTIFSAFGYVTNCQVARHRSGRSAGFAVLTFARRDDAGRALLVMDNAVLAHRKLNVRWYTPELQQSMGAMNFGANPVALQTAQTLAALLTAQQQVQQAPPLHQHMQGPCMPDVAAANSNQLSPAELMQIAALLAASKSVSSDAWAPASGTQSPQGMMNGGQCMGSNKWAGVAFPASANSSIPASSPSNLSEDGSSQLGHMSSDQLSHMSSGQLGHMGTHVGQKLQPADGLQGADMMIREDFGKSGARLGQHNVPYDWQPSLNPASLAALRNSAIGTGMPTLPARPMHDFPSVFQAPGNPLGYASFLPGQHNNASMQQSPADLSAAAAALNLLFSRT